MHGEGFFTEDKYDTNGNHTQNHTGDLLVVQQPGRNRDQNHNASDGQQQVTEVDRLKVRFRTVLFNPALTEREVNHGDQHTYDAQRERGAPTVTRS